MRRAGLGLQWRLSSANDHHRPMHHAALLTMCAPLRLFTTAETAGADHDW